MSDGYPPRFSHQISRGFLRGLGRLLIPLLFELEIEGKGNFPRGGPLLLVGNHTAVMEAALMVVYAPWQIEMLGSIDIPHEKFNQFLADFYGFIPVKRGHVDRPALQSALEILAGGGVIGIFPEGGIWEPGIMRAQTGVAWLSYRAKAPVLPIGFSGMLGALDQALKLKRPNLFMKVGTAIPPLKMRSGVARKTAFESYSEEVMSAVRDLLLPGDPSLEIRIENERFELGLEVCSQNGEARPLPGEWRVAHDTALAKLLHRPAILKIFRKNLQLPMEALQNLADEDDALRISKAIQAILDYLENENPYLLTYRFGPKSAEEMQLGLQELQAVADWAAGENLALKVTPVRRFYSTLDGKEIVQTRQDTFERWM